MKSSVKKILFCLFALVLLLAVSIGVFSASAVSNDPADSYKKQTAPNEDSSISMWFEHSFNKVMTSDKTHSGMDTYSIYMAKNEIENAQFVLYSASTKTGLRATVTNFTDFIFYSHLRFTTKLRGRYRQTHILPSPTHAQPSLLSASCTRVAHLLKPMILHQHCPKSIVYFRIDSGCWVLTSG